MFKFKAMAAYKQADGAFRPYDLVIAAAELEKCAANHKDLTPEHANELRALAGRLREASGDSEARPFNERYYRE